MQRHEFYYDLPQELIAQEPAEPRDHSRMLVMDKDTGELVDTQFYHVLEYLRPGDCLILNDSRVLPARLYGQRKETGAAVELLLLSPKGNDVWEVLAHYMTKRLEDKERYQTVYSRELGSAAAPTAGLHFTPELLQAIRNKGVEVAFVTLHVGLGTFRPVKEENIMDHKMHAEHYELSAATADVINRTRESGGRVIAVGTTSCRTLESVGLTDGKIRPAEGWTDIFIYPGYKFKAVDHLVTNFHLPESTLMMLISAFATREMVMNAYQEAIKEEYRFFSFGDSMLLY